MAHTDLKLWDIIISICTWWPKIQSHTKMSINNIPLEILFEREMWQEFKLMVFNLNLMFYYGMSNFFPRAGVSISLYF